MHIICTVSLSINFGRCTIEPGDAIIDCTPTFTMYVFDADVNGAKVVTGAFVGFLHNLS